MKAKIIGILALAILMALLSMPNAYAWDDDHNHRRHHHHPGTIKIKNETDVRFYVVIDDHNMKQLDGNDSEEFKTPPGERKVVLEYDDGKREIKNWIKVHPHEKSEWTITYDDIEYSGRER